MIVNLKVTGINVNPVQGSVVVQLEDEGGVVFLKHIDDAVLASDIVVFLEAKLGSVQ